MGKDQFQRRFQAFQIPKHEIERMYRRELEIQEEMRMMAENNIFLHQGQISSPGPGGSSNSTTPTPSSSNLESTLIYWQDATSGTWKFFVHDYAANTSSDIFDTELDYTVYTSVDDDYIIEQAGYAWQVLDSVSGDRVVFCVQADGTLIESFTYNNAGVDGRRNLEFISQVWYWVDGGQTYFKIFNGNVVSSASLPSAISTLSFNTGGGEASKNRTISFKTDSTTTYILTPSGDLVNITPSVGATYSDSTSLQSNFLSFVKQDGSNNPIEVLIFNEDGTLRNNLDISTYSITTLEYHNTYGENQWAGLFSNATEWIYVKYDYTGNTFSVENHTQTNHPNYSSVQDFRQTTDDLVNSRPNSVVYVYDNPTSVNWGADYSYLAFMWSIGSGETHKEMVNTGTAREVFISSRALYSQHPNFLIGPVGGTGPIEIGILRATGEIDFSNTGQLSEDCGGVGRLLIGNTTMYAFYTNSGDTRFEFWNTSQVTTHDVVGTLNWNFYVNGSVIVALNGDDPADSFWFAENYPTINAMPTLANFNVDSGMNWGTLTGIEESKLIFWENNTNSQGFSKLYILTNDGGLSSEITGNNTPAEFDLDLEKGVFNWIYEDETSGNVIISQYSLSTGSILSTVDTGVTSLGGSNWSSFGIRSLVWADDTPTVGSVTLWLQGAAGTTTTVIETGTWDFSHNDSEWAD
jgi:hypothetical protein